MQKTAYEMRISDWSSDVCSSDLDTHQARLWRYERKVEAQRPEWVATAPGPVGFDSLEVTAAGNICVATLYEGGITTITPDGRTSKRDIPGERYVTNIAFGGADGRDAYVTLSTTGRLAKLRWHEPGLQLRYNGCPHGRSGYRPSPQPRTGQRKRERVGKRGA